MATKVIRNNGSTLAAAPKGYPKLQETSNGIYWSLNSDEHVRLTHFTEPVGSVYYGNLRNGAGFVRDYDGPITIQNV